MRWMTIVVMSRVVINGMVTDFRLSEVGMLAFFCFTDFSYYTQFSTKPVFQSLTLPVCLSEY